MFRGSLNVVAVSLFTSTVCVLWAGVFWESQSRFLLFSHSWERCCLCLHALSTTGTEPFFCDSESTLEFSRPEYPGSSQESI